MSTPYHLSQIMFKAVIIDDEPQAVRDLAGLIGMYCPELDIVGSATSSVKGKELILNCKPDIVFLDIRIDERSGLQMLKELKNPEFEVIFVTAFEQYAIDALRLSAVDYLLKPVDVDLLTASVSRVTEKIKSADLSDSLASLLSNLSLVDKFDKKLKSTDY